MTVLRGAPQSLEAIHRRWILVNAVAFTAIVNLAVNGAFAWLSTLGTRRVPLWATPIIGGPSTITAMLGTLFFLPLITSLFVSAAACRDLRARRLVPVDKGSWPRLSRLPVHRLRRATMLGSICLAVLIAPAIAGLVAADPRSLSDDQFIVFNALFGAALGLVVTPVIAVAALLGDPHDGSTAAASRSRSG